jgi:glutaredoxin 3
MPAITIYTMAFCPFCSRAKALFDRKGVSYTEIEAAYDVKLKAEMVARSGGRKTFPQIFIGDTHVGGCDDLMALESAGKLDPILQASA